LEGKQRCSRAAVGEHAGIQAREWPRWLFTRNERLMKNDQTPATAHHTITTARRPDNIRSSALVRGRSTQFMANSCRWPQKRFPETRLHFRHFRRLFHVPQMCHVIYETVTSTRKEFLSCMKESCLHMNESYHTCKWDMSSYECVMFTCEWVLSKNEWVTSI